MSKRCNIKSEFGHYITPFDFMLQIIHWNGNIKKLITENNGGCNIKY